MAEDKVKDGNGGWFRRINGTISGWGAIRRELEGTVKVLVGNALARMDLVSREEFEAQAEVLRATRAKLDELEARLAGQQTPDEPGETGGTTGR